MTEDEQKLLRTASEAIMQLVRDRDDIASDVIGDAQRFKVGQELIFDPRSQNGIHVGKGPTVGVLDTKALPRRREGTRGAHRSKPICAPPAICLHTVHDRSLVHAPTHSRSGTEGDGCIMTRAGEARSQAPEELTVNTASACIYSGSR
jgi:hypothetical protein